MKSDKFGVDNVLIFAKGTYENPIITKILEINLTEETSIDYVRRFIYEREHNFDYSKSNSIKNHFGESLINEFRRTDFIDYQAYKSESREQTSGRSGGENNGNNKQDSKRAGDTSRSNETNEVATEPLKTAPSKSKVQQVKEQTGK